MLLKLWLAPSQGACNRRTCFVLYQALVVEFVLSLLSHALAIKMYSHMLPAAFFFFFFFISLGSWQAAPKGVESDFWLLRVLFMSLLLQVIFLSEKQSLQVGSFQGRQLLPTWNEDSSEQP